MGYAAYMTLHRFWDMGMNGRSLFVRVGNCMAFRERTDLALFHRRRTIYISRKRRVLRGICSILEVIEAPAVSSLRDQHGGTAHVLDGTTTFGRLSIDVSLGSLESPFP